MHSEEDSELEDKEEDNVRTEEGRESEAWIPMLTLLFCGAPCVVLAEEDCTEGRRGEREGVVVCSSGLGTIASDSEASTFFGASNVGVAG